MVKNIETESLIARGEMVNGIKADHYKLRKAALGFGGAISSGEMWVAQDGGYAVKLITTSDGTFNITADEIKGALTMEYNLTNINQVKEIVLPLECTKQAEGLSDLPMPTNATNVANLGGIYTFNSPDKPSVVADYFRKELPGKGWKITGDNSLGTDLLTLEIEKAGKKMSIMISTDGAGASVLITTIP
jgi:hypothetical protein